MPIFKHVDLNVDLSKFHINYCGNQVIIFSMDKLFDKSKPHVVLNISTNSFPNSELCATLYENGHTHQYCNLDEALMKLSDYTYMRKCLVHDDMLVDHKKKKIELTLKNAAPSVVEWYKKMLQDDFPDYLIDITLEIHFGKTNEL